MNTIWFDFDGTLVDVSKRYSTVHEIICEKLGVTPLPKEQYWKLRCEGKTTKEILQFINAEQYYNTYIEYRNEVIESLEFLEMDLLRRNVQETLVMLRDKYKLKIISGRALKTNLVEQLKQLHLYDFFLEIYTTSPFGGWKEKEVVLRKYAEAGDYIVGDHPIDIIAGKNAGLKTISVLGGMSTSIKLNEVMPEYQIKEIGEISKILHIT